MSTFTWKDTHWRLCRRVRGEQHHIRYDHAGCSHGDENIDEAEPVIDIVSEIEEDLSEKEKDSEGDSALARCCVVLP
jgi:hypothetical protein